MKEQSYIIGRDPSCDIVLEDDSVSRQHADLIVNEKGIFLLIDRDSTNGCFILREGTWEIVTQEIISIEDIVKFGEAKMSVKDMISSIPMPSISNPPPPPSASVVNLPSPPSQYSQPKKPWLKGDRLIRCQCGAVKRPREPCPECGL